MWFHHDKTAKWGTSELAQKAKAHATKPNDVSLISGTQEVGKRKLTPTTCLLTSICMDG